MPLTPRAAALLKAAQLTRIAQAEGTRRNIASSLVAHLPQYGVPARERPRNILRAFVWEMTGEREQLVRLLTACYRVLPERRPTAPEEKTRTY